MLQNPSIIKESHLGNHPIWITADFYKEILVPPIFKTFFRPSLNNGAGVGGGSQWIFRKTLYPKYITVKCILKGKDKNTVFGYS